MVDNGSTLPLGGVLVFFFFFLSGRAPAPHCSCISYFRNLPYPARITIRYQEETLSVYVNLRQKSSSQRGATKCAEVTGLYLPQGYYLGLTAETGGLFGLSRFSVYSLSPPLSPSPFASGQSELTEKKWGGPTNATTQTIMTSMV